MAESSAPQALIVLGMHRSGTSLAAALLQRAGLRVGRRLLGPRRGNPRGHFENLDFVEFHIRLLRARSLRDSGYTTTTDLEFTPEEVALARQLVSAHQTAPAWGWKDPRTTLFAGAWQGVLPEASFLITFRSPWETADSLFRRNSSEDAVFADEPELALDVWLAYNAALLRFAERHASRCLVVSARTLLARPQQVLSTLNDRLGFSLATAAADVAEAELLRGVDDEAARAAMVGACRPDALETFAALLRRSDLPVEPEEARWAHKRRPRVPQPTALRDWREARSLSTAVELLRAELAGKREGPSPEDLETDLERLRQHLDEAIRNAGAERDRFAAQLAESEHRAGTSAAEAQQAKDEVLALRQHLDEAIRNAAAERDRFAAQLAESEHRAGTSAAEAQQARDEIAALRQHVDEAVRNAAAERDRFATHLASVEHRAGTFAAEAHQAKEESAALRRHLDEAIRNAAAERERFTMQLAAAEHRAGSLAAEAQQAQEQVVSLRRQVEQGARAAAAERERLIADLAAAEVRAATDAAEIQQATRAAAAARELLDAAQKTLTTEREGLNSRLLEATAATAAAEAALALARAEATRAEQAVADAVARAEAAEAAAAGAADAAERQRVQLTQALQTLSLELDVARDATTRALARARDTDARAAAERDSLRAQLRAATDLAADTQERLESAQAEVDRLSYYLGDTMRNAAAERERLQRALGDVQRAHLDLASEGVKRTARRLRAKAWAKAVWLAEQRAPRATRAFRSLRARVATLADRRPSRRALAEPSVQDALGALEPALAQAAAAVETAPRVRLSIITPTWNTSPGLLADTARSVLEQSSHAWEWCVADDGSTDPRTGALLKALADRSPRIRVRLAPRGGIAAATNAALAMASGEFVAFLDHDDLLAPDAVAEVLAALDEGFDAVYTDEDKTDVSGTQFFERFHKPDWSPEYLRGVMYVGHLLAVRRDLVERVGGLDSRFDGVQDYDLVLRIGEAGARVGHVPKVLYHWRQVQGSVASDPAAKEGIERLQQAAVDAHLARLGLPASSAPGTGPHRVRIVPAARSTHPKVSVVIPTRDAPQLLGRCLESIYSRTTYPQFEVLVIDNDSQDPEALALMHRYPVRRLPFPGTFNYSKANNLGAAEARGEYLVFLNNDTEVLTGDWLDHLLHYAEQPDVGAVGALLLYPDRTVQHAGIVLGFRGTADHVMRGFPADVDGYAGSLSCAREVSAVTGACMMLSARRFAEVGRFNEHFATHYQDVDLCMRLRHAGLRNIFTPRAVLLHFESATRGPGYDMLDRLLLLDAIEPDIEGGDPFYNPNFDMSRFDYSVRQAS